MTRTTRRLVFLLLLSAVVGCHPCGDRPRLLSRLRDRDRGGEDDRRTAGTEPRRDTRRETDPNCDCLPAPRGTGFGQPMSGTGRFVSPVSGIPYSNPLPSGGFLPSSGGMPYGTPNGTFGPPYQFGPSRADELPPGSYIPSPNVPLAPMRPTDGTKLFPPLGGTGIMTGDPRK